MSASVPTASESPRPSPRTEAGRRRSRLNARIHGLTAALPDGAEEAAAMQQFADRWTAQLGPEAEDALIRSAAAAYGRLERCKKVEEATLESCARDAVARWEKKKRHAVRRTAQDLDKDPVNTVADLEASSFGCEWLMRQWRRLDASLAQGLGWEHRDLFRSMTLLGYRPQAPGPDGDPAVRRLWKLACLAAGHPVEPEPGLPTAPVPARGELRRLIASEFDRLAALREELWEHQDAAEAEAVGRAGMVDTTPGGQLRQRYRREAFSEMVRGLNQAMRLRDDRSREDDRRPPRGSDGIPLFPAVSGRRTKHIAAPMIPDAPPVPMGPPAPADSAPSPSPSPSPSLSPAPDFADARSEPTRPADHRNEPSGAAPDAAEIRRNPCREDEIRNGVPADATARDRRTEPRFDATPPRPDALATACPTRDGDPIRPIGADRRP